MPDAKLEAVRNLMRSVLEKAESLDLSEGKARKLEWEREKSELNHIILALENRLRQAELGRLRDEEPGRRQAADLEAWTQELVLAQEEWEREKAAQEETLRKERVVLEQERIALDIELQALQERRQQEQVELRRRIAALEASQLQVRATEESERADAASERAKAEAERGKREEELAQLKSQLEKAEQELQRYRQARTQSRPPSESAAQTPSLEQARAQGLSEDLPDMPGLEEELGPLPTLEAQLEPSWTKIVLLLQRSVSTCYGHLRRLSASRLQPGQQAVLKLAAADLAQAQDHLKVVGQFLEEAGPPPSEGRLEALLGSALNPWERAFRLRSLSLVRKFDPKLAPVLFHGESLRVALYQVVRNAYETMPRGGCLTVSLAQEASGQTRLSFSDTGPGFSDQALSQLFAPFATSKAGHLGLGLALARRTLQSLGGELEAGNGPGGGALVTLRFPAPSAAPPLAES